MIPNPKSILALDFGERRIGVAIASLEARLPRPLTTIKNEGDYMAEIFNIIVQEGVGVLVVGLPRNLSGESTQQTEAAQQFGHELDRLGLPVHFQDEALTSYKAQEELDHKGKQYSKDEIDALAASYILEDFLNTSAEIKL